MKIVLTVHTESVPSMRDRTWTAILVDDTRSSLAAASSDSPEDAIGGLRDRVARDLPHMLDALDRAPVEYP